MMGTPSMMGGGLVAGIGRTPRGRRGRRDALVLAMLIVAGVGAPALFGADPAPGQPAASTGSSGAKTAVRTAVRPAPAPDRIAISRLTYVYALPDPKSRVIQIVKPGAKLLIIPSAVRSAPLLAPEHAAKECCRNGMYDPDQQVDIIDRVGEGYVPIFHTTLAAFGQGPDSPSPDRPASCKGDPASEGCRGGAGLRDPSGLGSWIQVSTPDGRHRGWILVPPR